MARIRTIKPEFWQDEDLSEVSEPALLLAIGLLNHSDDEGYFKAHPGLLKAAVFPIREPSSTIHEMLSELSSIGYIKLFSDSDGKTYGRVVNFERHQKINRPSESKIKDLDGFTEISMSDHERLTTGKEQGTGNREQGKEQGKETPNDESLDLVPPDPEPAKPNQTDEALEVFEHWQNRLNHPRAKLDKKRRRKIRGAFDLGYTKDELFMVVDGCAVSPFHMGENDSGQVYDSIDLIFRDAEKIDRFIAIYHDPPKPKGKRSRIEAINEQAAQDFLDGVDPFDSRGATIDQEADNNAQQ